MSKGKRLGLCKAGDVVMLDSGQARVFGRVSSGVWVRWLREGKESEPDILPPETRVRGVKR